MIGSSEDFNIQLDDLDMSGDDLNMSLHISPTQRVSLLRKLVVSVPGRASPDLESHLDWFLRLQFLLLLKKKVVVAWKSDLLTNKNKLVDQETEHLLATPTAEKASNEEVLLPTPSKVSDDERQLARERIQQWRQQKEEVQRREQEQKMKSQEIDRQREEADRKRRLRDKLQLDEWRKAEEDNNSSNTTSKQQQQQQQQGGGGVDPEALLRLHLRDLQLVRQKQEKQELLSARRMDRQRKVAEAPVVGRVAVRDKQRLLRPTKASDAGRVTLEELDDSSTRRKTQSAHNQVVAMSGRDLQFQGRAVPVWCRHS